MTKVIVVCISLKGRGTTFSIGSDYTGGARNHSWQEVPVFRQVRMDDVFIFSCQRLNNPLFFSGAGRQRGFQPCGTGLNMPQVR